MSFTISQKARFSGWGSGLCIRWQGFWSKLPLTYWCSWLPGLTLISPPIITIVMLFITTVPRLMVETNKLMSTVLSCFSHIRLFATPWTTACQAPLSMGFSRQEYWVAIPSSWGSPQPRNPTHVSCVSWTGRQTLYPWATWEVQKRSSVRTITRLVVLSCVQLFVTSRTAAC